MCVCGGPYLVLVDAYSAAPHCYGVRCAAVAASVFVGEFNYATQLELIRNFLRDSIEKPTVFELSASLGASANSSSSAPYGVALDPRSGGFDAPSGIYELGKGNPRDDDESDRPACEFSDMIRGEVFAYKKMAQRDKKCDLCPFMEFSHSSRLIDHSERRLAKDQNWAASGFRQLRIDVALYNIDMERKIHTPSLPRGEIPRAPTICFSGARHVIPTSPNNDAFVYDENR